MDVGRTTTKLFRKKQMLTKGRCLAHYAKDKENLVLADASTSGLGITLWQKQDDGITKPIAFGSRYSNETEKKYSIGGLELLAVVWGLEKIPILFIRKESTSMYGSPSIGAIN